VSGAALSAIERVRRGISRVSVIVAIALLCVGLAASAQGSVELSSTLFQAVFWVLLAMPVVNVLAVLLEEIRGRDWTFVAIALVVTALIAWSILRNLR
jgi:hypothetical protein